MEQEPKQRTGKQNNSGHLWYRQIAIVLNDAGYEQKITFGTSDAPWTEGSVKILFSKISNAMYQKPHTSDLTTKEFTKVAEVLNRLLGEQGISVEFPSAEEIEEQSNQVSGE